MTKHDRNAKIVDDSNAKKKQKLSIRNFQISSSFENNVKNRNVNEQKNDDTKFISKKFKTKINFAINTNNIIYYVDINSRRSCIFITMKSKIFRLIHDTNQYSKIHRCYNKIINILYIFRFFKKIKKYIE